MRYRPRPTLVEAFQLIGGRYVVVPEGGEPRIAEASEFEQAFEPLDELELPIREVVGMLGDPGLPEPISHIGPRPVNRGRGIQVDDVDRLPEDAVPLKEAMRAPRAAKDPRTGHPDHWDHCPNPDTCELEHWYWHPGKDALSNVPFPGAFLAHRAPERPGKIHTPEDLRPAAERMQDAIAARTVPGGPGAPPPIDVDRAIEETRQQLAREQQDKIAIEGGTAKYRRLEEGEKPGTGRKACPKCNWSNPAAGRRCVNVACRKKFGG